MTGRVHAWLARFFIGKTNEIFGVNIQNMACRTIILFVAPVFLGLMAVPSLPAQTIYNVKNYGATGNGTTVDTAAIQSAVNAANSGGGGIVSFPPGTYKMGGGITLANNITVVLTNGAYLAASTNQSDWGGSAPNKIFYAKGCTNIGILGANGSALMDGGGLFFYQGDPGSPISGNHLTHMIEIHSSSNVTLANLNLQNSCEQTITFNDCSNITVMSVTVTNRPREFGSGDDGIDFSDCGYVTASNLNINTGDDGVCVKCETNHAGSHDIWIEDSTVASTCASTKFGTATYSPAYNIVFSNITVNLKTGIVIGPNNPLPDGRTEAAIAVEMCNGGFNHDVVFSHYTINECSIPIYVEVNDYQSGLPFGIQSNIFFEDINCLDASNACQINVESGATNNLFDLTFSNLTIHNFETTFTTNSPPYQDNGYPYGYKIGSTNVHMPAYGFFARYVNGLTFAGTNQFFDDGNSGRPSAIVLENVTTNLPSAPTNNGTCIVKANNNFSLDQAASWTNNAAPGGTNIAVWDSTVTTAANCTNALNANANWGGILIQNPVAPVMIPAVSTGTLSLGANGIDLSAANVGLSIGVAVTTVQPQTWKVAGAQILSFFATNKTVDVSSNLTINGAVNFSGNFNVSSNGTLTIPPGATLAATNPGAGSSFSVLQVGADATGGAVNQTGGNMILNSVGGTSGNPKVSMHIATAANSAGLYNLSGGSLVDTTTNNGSDCIVGDASGAAGTFNLSGGLAQFVSLRIGNNGGAGTVNITNGNLTVNGGEFSIGRGSATGSAGTMNVYGGTVSANVNLNLSHGVGPGILNLNGGIVSVPAIAVGSSAGTLNWNGGVLRATANSVNFISNSITVNIGAGGAVFDTTNFNVAISAKLLNATGGGADGGLAKLGIGTLTLTGTNTYNGMTVVSNGTLLVDNAGGSGTGQGNLIVESGAALGGTGKVAGNVLVEPGATLLAGLTVGGTVTYLTAPQTGPVFTSIFLNQTTLVLAGTNGVTNGVYFVLTSTNPASPLANWTMVGTTNYFDGNGNFSFTNALNPGQPAQFFLLSPSPPSLSTSDAFVLQALQNMRDEGFNSYLPSPGGLYINWIYTNNPPVAANMVNLQSSGVPDSSPTNRHDRLTDIVYLASLCLYQRLHPLDTQFGSEVGHYTTICLATNDDNFFGDPDERGWIYWVLEDIIPGVPAFAGADDAQADKYFKQYTNNLARYPGVTPLFMDFSTNEPGGYYTVANEIEDACVMIVNGHKRGLTNYVAAGEDLLAFQLADSWSTSLMIWPDQMGHVFTDGTKTQIAPPGAEYIYDAVIKPGALGEMTEALCWAEQADPGHGYGAWAKSVLDNLQPAVNGYTLWDSAHGGYYAQLKFTGSTNIYSPQLSYTLDTSYKEVGRFTVVVRAFLAANQAGIAGYSTNILATVNAAALASYYPAGHGWPYQENPDWSLYNNPVLQNWVTAESIGHATRSILSYELGE